MKRFIGIILALVLILGIVSSFAEDYPWGMSRDQLVKKMGKQPVEETDLLDAHLVLYDNQPISKYSASVAFSFYRDSLFARLYVVMGDYGKTKYEYLKGALTEIYGKPTQDGEVFMDALLRAVTGSIDSSVFNDPKTRSEIAALSDILDFYTWTTRDEKTNIIICYNDATYSTMVIYIQPNHSPGSKYNKNGL